MSTYTVLLRAEPEGGYTLLVPALPGCVSYGRTIDEALRMGEEAIACYLDGEEALGKPVPEEGPELTLRTEDLAGTLLAYKLSPDQKSSETR